MFFYTYVLRSNKDGHLYIGWTKNLSNRFSMHSKGEVLSTKNRRPLELVYFEGCLSESAAIAREKQLKTGFGRLYLKKRVF
ncbi:MAG TPA: GIY-YIG nuclease family protein [Candidatus Paceibacterota bacterium]